MNAQLRSHLQDAAARLLQQQQPARAAPTAAGRPNSTATTATTAAAAAEPVRLPPFAAIRTLVAAEKVAAGASTGTSDDPALLIHWALHRLLTLEVLELTPKDLAGAVDIVQEAVVGLQQSGQPSAAAVAAAAAAGYSREDLGWQHAQQVQQLQLLLRELLGLQGAMDREPGKIRKLCRYGRRCRERWEARRQQEFTLNWDYAEGKAGYLIFPGQV